MIEVTYAPSFVRQFKSLEPKLANEVLEKTDLFKDQKNHRMLKVHKLKGILADKYSFSVNYRIRILFKYSLRSKKEVFFLAIDDHDIYK